MPILLLANFQATRTIADLLLVAKISRHEDRLAVVANRVKRNTVVFRSLMKFLESLEIPVAAVLRDTQNYIRTASEGAGLTELKRADVIKDVVQWKRLVGWLESDNPGVRPTQNPDLAPPEEPAHSQRGIHTLQ